MVIGEQVEGGEAMPPSPQQFPPQKATIENIMSGIENTGAVKMNNHRKKLRQRFDIIKKLGQGTYGKVQLGINKETGQEVAIKTIKKSKIETEADLIRIRREVQIMSSVYHPNIIHIYEVFENREKMILVMEFAAGGELYDYLSERKVLAEEEARRIFRQVSTAIYYCHKHKICHRDLKLENILLDENGNAKIADFGLSNVFDEQRLLATFCGSPLYASPEIVKGTPYQGPEVDCWSLGVLLYTLVYGAMPFDGANFKRLVKQISQGDYFEPKKPSRASPLIREMLTVCPSHRANIEQICNHWWVNEGYDESCLDLAEELANQTPVRLDVLLSLSPPSVMADQLVVGNGQEDAKAKDRIQRSHSMGSIVDMGGTEAERRILDMVAAGGEAALMPSPTRTITPAEAAAGSPAQTKRKLETTVSTENATGAVKKKDKADPPSPAQPRIPEDMDVEEAATAAAAAVAAKMPEEEQPRVDAEPSQQQQQPTTQEDKPTDKPSSKPVETNKFEAQEVLEDLQNLENMCDELLLEAAAQPQAQSSENNSTAVKGQSETVAANGAAAAGPAVAPAADAPAKSVSSVRAKLEKLEKGDTDPKPIVPTTAIPAVRKIFGKNKTTDLTSAINEVNSRKAGDESQPTGTTHRSASSVERKNSLPDESLARTAERRKSRILETAEKFQNLNQQAGNGDKFKKFVLPGGGVPTVGNYKKEFERKTGLNNSSTFTKPPAPQTATLEQRKRSDPFEQDQQDREETASTPGTPPAFVGSAKNLVGFQQQHQQQQQQQAYDAHLRSTESPLTTTKSDDEVKESDSKSSVGSFSLEDARRSMENSIAMLNRAKPTDSSAPSTPTSIDQLCARTESVSMVEDSERERKLKNAREIIGNAIPIGRLRKPPMPFGANGRSTTGTLGINKPYRMGSETPEPRCDTMSIPRKVSIGSIPCPPKDETKTSHAEITLKSATLPRRKLSKPLELQGDAQLKADQRMQQSPQLQPAFAPMRFSTEMQHQMPDLRSAPIGREHPPAFAPMAHQHQQHLHHRANSLEPQGKEQPLPGASFAGPQKPPTYQRTASGYGPSPATGGRGSLSRQSTNESNDSDNTISQGPISTNASGMMSGTVSTSGSTTMPIKKSPREYIIPIAVEGGGIVTPRANSLEPSESNASSGGLSGAGAGFGMKPRLGRPRRLGSLLAENDAEAGDVTSFPRLNRHTSLGRESDSEEPKFHMMHRLRSTRPSKRGTADPNESASSGEEDDDDGFEILTAENLFSTLLSRVRALTNRLNVNDVNSSRFPASRFMNNLRQTQTPFWHHQDPFGRNLTEGGNAANAWRHSMSRDLSTDIDSMFSRSGATLPRGEYRESGEPDPTTADNNGGSMEENLDLRDLDLSQLRLSKRDLETLSSITPALSQRVQEQLLAQLPPQQARKLSRTLSMQNGGAGTSQAGGAAAANQRLYRRSYSNSSGNRSLDATERAEYGSAGWSSPADSELRRRGGSQPRDILSPPPAYQTPAPLYEKYAPYGTSIPTTGHNNSAGDSSGMSAFVREYDHLRKPLPSPHTTTLTTPGTRTTTTPLRYTSSPDPTASTKRLSRFLRPDFFDTPKEMGTTANERDSASSSDRNSPYSSGGVTLREGATDRQQRREKLANDTITDRLSYFLEKYGKPDDEPVGPVIGDRARRSVSRTRDLDDEGVKQSEPYRTPAETLSMLQEQLQDLTNITSLAAGSQMSKLLRGNDETPVSSVPATSECQLPGCAECDGKSENGTVQTTNGSAGEVKEAAAPVKKIVKVKKVKVVKKAATAGDTTVSEKSSTGDTAEATPPTVTVVKKVKKVETNAADTKEGPSTIAGATIKKESKLMRPKSYPYKETAQDGAKLSVAGEIELETSVKPMPIATPKEPSTEGQSNGTPTTAAANGVASTVSKIARPKSFPASKLTPPKELKLLKSPVSEAESLDAAKVEPSTTPTTPVAESATNGTPTSTTSPPKKVKKVIRIVKKVTKTTDSSGKVVVTTTTMPVDGGPLPKGCKETTTKTVTIKEEPAGVQNASSTEKPSTVKEKSKSPEKKPKQGFLASIGQRFEKFRDTSRSSKEKKAAAAAASASAAASTAAATITSVTSNESLPDTAVPAMVPGSGQIVDGVTPDVLKPSEPVTLKKDKKKVGKTIAKGAQADDKPSTDEPIGKATAGSRKSRIDTVIKNLRELSTGPKLPELTESKLIKRAVSVEEMPGTFNRCGVTKVLGLFKKIEKDSRNNAHHRLLNTKSSSHIMTSGRSVDEGILAPMPDLMQPVPVESGRMRNGDSLLPGPTQQLRKKMYGGARSDTVLPMDTLLSNGVDGGDYEQRKFKVASGVGQSQIPVKYGCPGCDTGCNTAAGSSHTSAGTGNGSINGVHVGSHGQQATAETDSGSNGMQRPPPQDTDRKGRARALTIDLEQAVHSATEKLKRLQQANSIHLSNNLPTQPLLHHHSNHSNNNYISNPSKPSLSACTKPLPSHSNTANGTTNHTSSSTLSAAPTTGGNNNYSYPPPLPGELVPTGTATSPGGYNSMSHSNNINNNPSHHYSTLTPSYDSITNYSSGSRSSPYDDNSSSTFLSPSEERELYFDSWSVCSDELIGGHGGGGSGGGRPLNSSSASPAPSSSAASRRHSSVRLLTSNPPLHSVSPVDPDAESVIERIRRKSFYTRFNDTKKPAKRASASNLGALGGAGSASGHLKDTGGGSSSSSNSYGYYGGNANAGSVGSMREKSLSRGGSTSYILRPNKESSFSGVGKYETPGYATLGRTEHHHRGYATMVNLTKANRSAARLRNSSLDVVPLVAASGTDYQHHQPPPHYHHHHHHHHRQQQPTMGGSLSRTGSRLLSTDDDPLTDGLNYNNLINNNHHNNNNTTTSNHKYTRNTYYESSAVPSSYGTYTPRRRSSFVAGGAGYGGSSNIASSSSSIALDLLKDHARDGSASHGNLATTTSSSSSNTLSASDNYGIGSSNSSSTASRTLRPYETRSSSLLTPTALREAGRYSGRYDSGTLTKNYRTRTTSTSKSTDNA
ncbi:serine-rich adhesin for platelets [Anopheles stephensi]|uniref:serine-rich adhesin for platelets n=1 Tax=Anopheles stephensi TaxID=30069 RepID=UPI0016587E75|nr:serine-rich adhesin for platelets [Anopheles stephensi]